MTSFLAGKKANPFTRQILENAARRGKWEVVDEHLGKITTAENVMHAYASGIKDRDENTRDFYFSLIEKARIPKETFSRMRTRLFNAMRTEPGKYAKFRAACALASHGAGKYAKQMMLALKPYEFDQDPTVQRIAKTYRAKLEKQLRNAEDMG